MRRILSVVILVMLAAQAEGSVFFKIVEVPAVQVNPGEEAGFTVFIQNLGSQSGYAGLMFRNIPEGLSIVGPRCTKWVDSGTKREFDCQLRVEAADVPPGNYTFEIGIVAAGAPPGWTPVEVIVSGELALEADLAGEAGFEEPEEVLAEEEYPPCPIVMEGGGAGEDAGSDKEETPGFGISAALGAMALLLIMGRGRRG
jgi:hypothetical protein